MPWGPEKPPGAGVWGGHGGWAQRWSQRWKGPKCPLTAGQQDEQQAAQSHGGCDAAATREETPTPGLAPTDVEGPARSEVSRPPGTRAVRVHICEVSEESEWMVAPGAGHGWGARASWGQFQCEDMKKPADGGGAAASCH